MRIARVATLATIIIGSLGCRAANVDAAPLDVAGFESTLKAHFQSSPTDAVKVAFDLLRPGPTVTGIAWPKYYLWIRLDHSDGKHEEKAVRVAEMDGKFEVTHALRSDEILSNPSRVSDVFPADLNDNIHERASAARKE